MPVGEVDEAYTTQIDFLTSYASAQHLGLTLDGVTVWAAPLAGGNPVSNLDIPGQVEPFDRENISAVYADALASDEGSLGDCIAMRLQGDYLSAMERAYRSRTASTVRRRAWMAARLRGHGDSDLGIFARLQTHVQDVLISGSDGFLPPAWTPLPGVPDLVAQAAQEHQARQQATGA